VRYSRDGESLAHNVVGGSGATVREVLSRDWTSILGGAAEDFDWTQPGRPHRDAARLRRAQGCLLGQVAGDSLGSLVEFLKPEAIRERFPTGVRDLRDGGTWGTIAGQPTDDSELAITLARSLVRHGGYRARETFDAYVAWYRSGPFDVGTTTAQGMAGRPNAESQANGSLMRASPLGVAGWNRDVSEWVRSDSSLTHPNPVCVDACAAFVAAVGHAVAHGDPRGAHAAALAAARTDEVRGTLRRAAVGPPEFLSKQGWVLVALQNAFFRLLHHRSLEEALVDTVHEGGDTDTNAAIAGALLGAALGRDAVPLRWRQMVLSCRPIGGVRQPRPREYWPIDLLEIAERLLEP
jgi:ADP-ribosylglycohydrolase